MKNRNNIERKEQGMDSYKGLKKLLQPFPNISGANELNDLQIPCRSRACIIH